MFATSSIPRYRAGFCSYPGNAHLGYDGCTLENYFLADPANYFAGAFVSMTSESFWARVGELS
jgi:hypothetical protein